MLSRQSDCALVGLRPGIAKENLGIPRDLAQALCQQRIRQRVEQIRDVLHQLELRGNGVHPFLVAEAQGVCADAAAKVDVRFSGKVLCGGSTPALNSDRKTVISMYHIGFVFVENILFSIITSAFYDVRMLYTHSSKVKARMILIGR